MHYYSYTPIVCWHSVCFCYCYTPTLFPHTYTTQTHFHWYYAFRLFSHSLIIFAHFHYSCNVSLLRHIYVTPIHLHLLDSNTLALPQCTYTSTMSVLEDFSVFLVNVHSSKGQHTHTHTHTHCAAALTPIQTATQDGVKHYTLPPFLIAFAHEIVSKDNAEDVRRGEISSELGIC